MLESLLYGSVTHSIKHNLEQKGIQIEKYCIAETDMHKSVFHTYSLLAITTSTAKMPMFRKSKV